MDIYEQLVHCYLTAVEACAVIPRSEILQSIVVESWTQPPDFLAIDFRKQVIQIIEVIDGWGAAARLGSKLKHQHRGNIEALLAKYVQQEHLDFPIIWRFFARRDDIPRLESNPDFAAFRETGCVDSPESLEDVFDTLKAAIKPKSEMWTGDEGSLKRQVWVAARERGCRAG